MLAPAREAALQEVVGAGEVVVQVEAVQQVAQEGRGREGGREGGKEGMADPLQCRVAFSPGFHFQP